MSQTKFQEGEVFNHRTHQAHSIKILWGEAQGRLWAVELYDEKDYIQVCYMTSEQINSHYLIPEYEDQC